MVSARPLGRISSENDFRRVYLEGFRCSTALLLLHVRPDRHHEVRLGLAVGRRFGGAVARNRLRRRLREAVREYSHLIRPGVDLVVIPREAAVGATFTELRAAAREALTEAGLLGDASGSKRDP